MDVDERVTKYMFVKAEYDKALLAALRAGGDRTYVHLEEGLHGNRSTSIGRGGCNLYHTGLQYSTSTREKEDHHLLVGECFVWGLMVGEAFDGKEEKRKTVTFRLR